MKRFIIVAAFMAVALPAVASSSIPVCNVAPEAAYEFIERAFTQRPDIAFSPLRTKEQSGMFVAACEDGFKHGREKESAKLNAIYEQIEVRAHQPQISPEEARYIIGDMAEALAFKFGYLEGIK